MSRFSSVGDAFKRLGNEGLETQSNLTKDHNAFGSLFPQSNLGQVINKELSVFSEERNLISKTRDGPMRSSEYMVLNKNQSEAQILQNRKESPEKKN